MGSKILIAGKPDQIQNYVQAFQRFGVESISIFQCSWKEALALPGLVLPGGGDISPSLMKQENQGSVQIDETLDRLQFKILEEFCKARKPILGICKGLQVINVYFGGTIVQQLPTAHMHEYRNGDQNHMTIALQDSVLERLYGLRFPVNSAHHQGIGVLGNGLEAIQFAKDQVIEGIIHKKLPILGVQWHPERMQENEEEHPGGDRLLEFWIQHLPSSQKMWYDMT
ncbi:MAG: gamma-glutamyl-gamma-aminobutyrate hydrolase family protein [Bacteroides sp.]|nr:gamma-glutamyl-gamma-aminobutyrate hydrolase family protein [Bacteroides sp.]MCM1551019.1 gamma-glutamyl-gamma-aminobutyrate hydrolase family protein [Clostridium sp.]